MLPVPACLVAISIALLAQLHATSGSSSTNGLNIERGQSETFEVLEGLPYTLSCSCVMIDSQKNYTHLRKAWHYQERDLESTPRRSIYSGEPNTFSTHLKFQYVDRSDAGVYRCEFQNTTFGAIDGNAISKKIYFKVIYVDVPQVVVVNKTNDTVTLQCIFSSWHDASVNIQWLHNFRPIPGPVEFTITRNLTITNVTNSKTGIYQCQVWPAIKIPENSPSLRGAAMQNGSLLSSNWFTLDGNPKRSTFDTSYNPQIFVKPNTSFEIKCPFIMKKSRKMVWSRLKVEKSNISDKSNQSEKSHASFHTMLSSIDPVNGSLYSVYERDSASFLRVDHFQAVECYNVMKFWCARETSDEEEKAAFMVGLEKTQRPKILQLFATQTMFYSRPLSESAENFCITAIMNYVIVDTTVQWQHRSAEGLVELTPGNRYEIQKLPSGNARLCMKPADFVAGRFSVIAQNAYGKAEAQIEIKRWQKANFREFKAERAQLKHDGPSYSLKVLEGSSFSLLCNYSENYLAIHWKIAAQGLNGLLNYNSSIFTVYERTGLLEVKNITLDWTGNYTCTPDLLYNYEQVTSSIIVLNVTRSLKVLGASASVVEGKLMVDCVVENDQWHNYSVNLYTEAGNPLQNFTYVKEANYSRIFRTVITRGQFPSKQFRCDARSNDQHVSSTFSIETLPKMIMRPENVTSMLGDLVLLHCQPESDDDWRVHWRSANSHNYVDDCNERNALHQPCVMRNGSLRFASVELMHAGWWTCLVALKGISGLSFDYDYNDTSLLIVNERLVDVNNITRTVTIVIVSAVIYLALVVGITLWCSMRLMRKRKRRTTADDTQMTLLGSENGRVCKPNGVANGNTRMLSVATVRPNGVGQPASPVSPAFASQPSGSLHSSTLPAPAYTTAVHVSPAGSLPQASKHSGASPGALPPPPPPSNNVNVYSPARMPAYAWPIQDIRSTLTRTSCSTCDGLSAGGIPVLCALHSAAMPSGIVSEYPHSVLSHQTNITSVSQQYQGRAMMLHHPATTTPNSQSNCSSEAVRHIPRSQVQFLGRIGLGRFGDVTFGQLLFAHPGPDQVALPIRVAIKALSKSDEEARRDFHKEIDTFHGVQHAFVTELLGVCLEEEPLLLLFEYPEWGTLKHFLLAVRADHERLLQALVEGSPIDEQAPLPPLSLEQRVMMCLHVTAGMDYLAQHGRVHGELACRNLLLASNLSLKVGLLGVQDVFAGEYYHVPYGKNGTRKSKPISLRWMAPECVVHEIRVAREHESASASSSTSARSDAYTSACDVWSFAMTALEIFTYGELPFATLTDVQVLDALLNASSDKNAARLVDLATHCVPRFTNAIVPPAKVGGVLPDPHFNDFRRCPQSLRHILEQCWRVEARHRPSFADISVAFGEQLGDCKM